MMFKKKFALKTHSDIPVDNAKSLSHDIVIDNLRRFIESKNLATPLSIALHGDWGSGKTSVMKTLEKKFKDSEKIHTVFFETWKYEYSNPTLGLVNKILTEMNTDADTAKRILKIGFNIFLNKFADTNLNEIVDSVKENTDSQNLNNMIENQIKKKLGNNKKLLVIIDDLDRCDIENTLMLLALVKLFLDIKNCVCIAAVDFKRLEHAWFQKYGLEQKFDTGGRSYFEKIFQLSIAIPDLNEQHIRKYLENLVGKECPSKLLYLMTKYAPANPRAMKRLINLMAYRAMINEDTNDPHNKIGQTVGILWTLLEEIITIERVIKLRKVFGGPTAFALYLLKGDKWEEIERKIKDDSEFYADLSEMKLLVNLKHFFKNSKEILEEQKIMENRLEDLQQCITNLTSTTNAVLR